MCYARASPQLPLLDPRARRDQPMQMSMTGCGVTVVLPGTVNVQYTWRVSEFLASAASVHSAALLVLRNAHIYTQTHTHAFLLFASARRVRLAGSKGGTGYQFIMELLLRVMKKT